MTFIRSAAFDGSLVLGCAFIALIAGWWAFQQPIHFNTILMADIWLLGSHHVVATYTRLCFDKESFKEHKFFVLGLPWLVMAGILAAMWYTGGRMIISTIYLYWQWFHYTRQSWGIARIYGRKCPPGGKVDDILTRILIYGVPLWGILYRSHQHPLRPGEKFLGSDFWAIPVPDWLLWGVGIVAFTGLAIWIFRLLWQSMDGQLPLLPNAYLISHVIIFMVGYYFLGNVTMDLGWLVINIWHNAQYILIVWLYNNNRFRNGVSEDHKFLSFISQKKFLWLYLGVCLFITFIFYTVVEFFSHSFAPNYLPMLITDGGWAVVCYQGINFHHYIVDGYIWKVRKKRVRERLGVDPAIADVVE